MSKPFTRNIFSGNQFFHCLLLPAMLLLSAGYSFSQCTILPNAVQGISYTYVQVNGTNASGVAYNPDFNIYYAVTAGNSGFPYETFDPSGTALYQTNAGFDFRGLWWNPNTNEVEGNGYFNLGLWTSDLDINGYALNSGTNLFVGQNQPDAQSCGDYDYDANEILYYFNGFVYRYDRNTDVLLGSYPLTGSPVPLSKFNTTTLMYTGCCGNEIALEDYVDKAILFFSKSTGAYTGKSLLPGSAVTNASFNISYANNLVWLYDISNITWTSYSVLSGNAGGNEVNLGNDTALCEGSTLVLNAGSSTFQYAWSTGSTDSTITVDSAGTYWLTVTNGNCIASDTIIIIDTICSPLIAFNSSDTSICQKFCINFFDSSQNNPTSWLWLFDGASPSSSTAQNPTNICYNDSGSFNVTLITTSSSGIDTLTLPGYITVFSTPPFPTITQVGYDLTASAGSSYQWQLNSVDIPGATNQTYSALQSGLYTVLVYDDHGCKNSATVLVQIEGISEVNGEINISVLPNPGTGLFTLEFSGIHSGESISLRIENSLGQIIYSFEQLNPSGQWKKEIDLRGISSGVYFLDIRAGDEFATRKIIKSE